MKKSPKSIADVFLARKSEGEGAVLIEGAKWCGKTTTAEQVSKIKKDYLFPICQDVFGRFQNVRRQADNLIIGIPILFFGNIDRYLQSKIKIITIGQNPSREEFPQNCVRLNKFQDFTDKDRLSNDEAEQYLQMLNMYFDNDNHPYLKWFSQFNWYLQQFSGSYDSKADNRAVHIDLNSTFATNPTWGRLTRQQQDLVSQPEVFKKLFYLFNPDVVLCNFNLDLLNGIIIFDGRINEKIDYGQKRPETKIIEAGKSGDRIFVGNTSGPSPFAYISQDARESFFDRLRNELI